MSKFQLGALAVLMASFGMSYPASFGKDEEPKPASPITPAASSTGAR